ncbi:MAG: hypothetical protein HQ508_02695 [Candidatus Marinimicrobia bacterium]|nr:hypothetical protein [Candidatus Neomarinimicrobiota bacterium]
MQNNECIYICDQYTDYQENTLSSNLRAEVETHLSLCTACSDLFRELSQTLNNLHNLPIIKTRPDFTATLMARIDDMNQQSVWQKIYSSSYPRVAGYAIAAGLVVALGLNFWINPKVPMSPMGTQKFATEQNMLIPDAEAIVQGIDSTRGLENDSLRGLDEIISSDIQPLQLVNGTK